MLKSIPIPRFLDSSTVAFQPQASHRELIQCANERVDLFTRSRAQVIHNFVVSDFGLVGCGLAWIRQRRLMCGNVFCEWGSGFGVVTLLAAIEQMDALGIEVEPDLIEQSRKLADDFGLAAEFAEGSFLPEDRSIIERMSRDIDNIDLDSASVYDQLGKSIDDFDLVFAFPWPGEQQFFARVFDQFAADGALLLMFNGRNELTLQRRSA